jgi:uncharacterized membrane protein YesL
MLNPFRALGKALRDLFDEFLPLTVANLLWAVFSLPLWWVAVGALLQGAWAIASVVALLGVLPAGPALAGLFAMAFKVADGRAVKFGDFFTGMRAYARPGWAVVGVATLTLLLIVYNLGFYANVSNLLGGVMLGLWLYGLVFWLGLLVYAPALVVLQDTPSLRLVARNAFLMALGRPIFTLITMVLMLAIVLVSAFLMVPVFLFTASFLALWSINATRQLVDDARRRREAADAAATAAPSEERGRKGQVRPK